METQNWECLYCTDCERLEVSPDGTEVALEIAEDQGDGRFLLYRIDIKRFKLVTDNENPMIRYLVPFAYDSETWSYPASTYNEWFVEHLNSVANITGETAENLLQAFTSASPTTRAMAYSSLIAYFGPFVFDQYPIELTAEELDKRWV